MQRRTLTGWTLAKGATRGLVGAFERDAIRPHIAGRFEDDRPWRLAGRGVVTIDLVRPEPSVVPEWSAAPTWLIWLDFAVGTVALLAGMAAGLGAALPSQPLGQWRGGRAHRFTVAGTAAVS